MFGLPKATGLTRPLRKKVRNGQVAAASVNHDEEVRKIVSAVNSQGYLKSRESSTVEFKQAFSGGRVTAYARAMAAFANNGGGYIIFGVKDRPREVVGIKPASLENLDQERFTDAINSLFAPGLDWECGTVTIINMKAPDGAGGTRVLPEERHVGWIYTAEAETKPVIAQKADSGERISSGDVFYRYRARNEKIRFPEMMRIVEERAAREREGVLRLFEAIRKSGTANLGIVNYRDGRITTPYGVDVSVDRRLVAQVLKRAKFIKEGSFHETKGMPVIRVTGDIHLAEEVPVRDRPSDELYPYIQKALAQMLGVPQQDLYALVWHYRMKDDRKYSEPVTTSLKGDPTYKFSEHASQFLRERLSELNDDAVQFDKIRVQYRCRNRQRAKSAPAIATSQAPCEGVDQTIDKA